MPTYRGSDARGNELLKDLGAIKQVIDKDLSRSVSDRHVLEVVIEGEAEEPDVCVQQEVTPDAMTTRSRTREGEVRRATRMPPEWMPPFAHYIAAAAGG